MDPKDLSDSQLLAVHSGDYSKLTNDELLALHGSATDGRSPDAATEKPQTFWDKIAGSDAIKKRFAQSNEQRANESMRLFKINRENLNAERAKKNLDPINTDPTPEDMTFPALKQKSIFDSLLTGHADNSDSAKAMMESISAPGQIIRSGVSKALSGMGAPELKAGDALGLKGGEASSYVDILKKQLGAHSAIAYPLGMAADFALDPMNKFIGRGTTEPQELGKVGNAIKSIFGARPIGNQIEKLGEKIYSLPFRKANENVRAFSDSASRGPKEVSNLVQEVAPEIGGFGKDNITIANEVNSLKQSIGKSMGDQLGNVASKHDLAPTFTQGRQAKRAGAVEEYLDNLSEKAAPEQVEAAKTAIESNPELRTAIENTAEDTHVISEKKRLLDGLTSGGPNSKKAALEELKTTMPEMSDEIDLYGKMLSNGDKNLAATGLEKLIGHGFEGPRSASELQDLAKFYGQKASGSEAMKTNFYKLAANKKPPGSFEQATTRRTLADIIEQKVKEQNGPEGLAEFQDTKNKYSTLARGYPKVQQVGAMADAKQGMSKLDMIMALEALHNPIHAVAGAGGIFSQLLNNSLKYGTGVGNALKSAGQSDFIDRTLVKKWMDSQ